MRKQGLQLHVSPALSTSGWDLFVDNNNESIAGTYRPKAQFRSTARNIITNLQPPEKNTANNNIPYNTV